jgi:hypothetical protein
MQPITITIRSYMSCRIVCTLPKQSRQTQWSGGYMSHEFYSFTACTYICSLVLLKSPPIQPFESDLHDKIHLSLHLISDSPLIPLDVISLFQVLFRAFFDVTTPSYAINLPRQIPFNCFLILPIISMHICKFCRTKVLNKLFFPNIKQKMLPL